MTFDVIIRVEMKRQWALKPWTARNRSFNLAGRRREIKR
jgi:hypothetical protein